MRPWGSVGDPCFQWSSLPYLFSSPNPLASDTRATAIPTMPTPRREDPERAKILAVSLHCSRDICCPPDLSPTAPLVCAAGAEAPQPALCCRPPPAQERHHRRALRARSRTPRAKRCAAGAGRQARRPRRRRTRTIRRLTANRPRVSVTLSTHYLRTSSVRLLMCTFPPNGG